MILNFFKKKPEKPPITNKIDFIMWHLKYYDDPKLEKLDFSKSPYDIGYLTQKIMDDLNKYQDTNSLLNHINKLKESYNKDIANLKEGDFLTPVLKDGGKEWKNIKHALIVSLHLKTAKLKTLPFFLKEI